MLTLTLPLGSCVLVNCFCCFAYFFTIFRNKINTIFITLFVAITIIVGLLYYTSRASYTAGLSNCAVRFAQSRCCRISLSQYCLPASVTNACNLQAPIPRGRVRSVERSRNIAPYVSTQTGMPLFVRLFDFDGSVTVAMKSSTNIVNNH